MFARSPSDEFRRLCPYVLLMRNWRFYQNGIAEFKNSEVKWTSGTSTRVRSKTRERGDSAVITYPLWPQTLMLLLRHWAAGDLVLTTDGGQPLVRY